jgi:hypothetical protein
MQNVTKTLLALGLFAMAALVAVEPAFGQTTLNLGTTSNTLRTQISVVFQFVRLVIVGVAIIGGIWQGFKASRGGDSKGWIGMVGCFFVAGFAAAPAMLLNLIGMTNAANLLTQLGL